MSNEIRFAGPVASDPGHGLIGGSCALAVAGGVFVLQLARQHIHGIEDLDTVRGACTPAIDGYRLEARAWRSRTAETTTVEADRPLAARWHARFAGLSDWREAALELRFVLATQSLEVLLLRQPPHGVAPDPVQAAWLEVECACREATAAAERERRTAAQEHARRAAESTPAFAAHDYARVEALLGPIEAVLSPAERQRLAMARRHLGSNPV